MLKCLINYVIFMTLLFEVFAHNWVREDQDYSDSWVKTFMSYYIETIRSVYQFPLIITVQMAQCQNFNSEQDNGILTREKGAFYSGSAVLTMVVIFVGHKIIKLYFFKENVEQD